MLKTLSGDLFASHAQTLVNAVNCVGVMGKGIALEFKKRYPAMFEDYVARCRLKKVRLGEPYLFRDLGGVVILNFPTKDHWRSPSRLKDIDEGLEYFAEHAADWGVTSVAFPPLGCGNGGLAWSDVEPLMHRKLGSLPIEIEIYSPFRNE
jgi:O-acetyl-ADP-ribose deacetylase (regulator of RNase III)